MNRLVLIGNGFDLAHGLKTSYANFIKWYWKERVKKLSKEATNISSDPMSKITAPDGFMWAAIVANRMSLIINFLLLKILSNSWKIMILISE